MAVAENKIIIENKAPHILQKFYGDIATTGEHRLHIVKRAGNLQRISKRQTTVDISRFMRALYAHNISTETRILFQASAGYKLWVAEWAALANHCVAVIAPHQFTQKELLFTLAESKSKLAIVDTREQAQSIAGAADKLPDLKHIICFEGDAAATIPILSWDYFMESGDGTPDRSGALLRSLNPKDTAILFYYQDEHESIQATRYSHELLLSHTERLDSLLGNSATIHKDETVLSVTAWSHVMGHIVSSYLAVLKEATMQINRGKLESDLFESRPHVIVGNGASLDALRQLVLAHIKLMGPGARKELDMVLALGKLKYETGKLNPWQRLGYTLLRHTIMREIQEFLGGRLRLFISVDDTVRYETQLFFETFGVELVELPPDILSH